MTDGGKKSLFVSGDANTRLDKWLAAEIPGLSRARLQTLIAAGAVRINGHAQHDPAYKVKSGQSVEVSLAAAVDATPMAQAMDLVIVYEDADLIVVDKPAGLVVHPAAGNPDRTLVNALLAHCGDSLQGIGGVRRPGIVHRIDKDTSGLIVAAKTEGAHAGLSTQFAAHTIERRYDALVWGIPKPANGQISSAIGRNPHNRKKMAVVARGGKSAATSYSTLESFGAIAAHVQCRLMTGRTHQIRVHMTSKGHGLIGDKTYGGERVKSLRGVAPEIVRVLKHFPRQALHAATLGFVHPVSGKALRFESPLPDDMVALRDALRQA